MIKSNTRSWDIPFISVISIIVLILASLPLFHAGLFPTMDNISVIRMQSMATQLLTGQFPVRYSEDLARGHGYELFHYYAPLPFYAGALMNFIGINIVGALKRTYFLAFLFAAFGMAGLSQSFFGPVGAGISVIMFIFSPYFGYDMYWRGDVGEVLAMSFIPWVLWFIYRAMKHGKLTDGMIASFMWALVIVSHTLTAYMASAALCCWLVIWSIYMKRSAWMIIRILAASFGLAAFFWMPLAMTRENVWVMYLQGNISEILTQTLGKSLKELFFPSFQPMIINWLALSLPIVGAVAVIKYSREHATRMLVKVALGFFLIAFFMTSRWSGFLWTLLFPFLYMFQFPWRFLIIFSVFGALLSGGIVLVSHKYRYGVVIAIVVIALIVNWSNFRPRSYEFVDRYVPEDPCGTSWGFEYLPVWVGTCLKTSWEKPYKIQSGDLSIIKSEVFPQKIILETRGAQNSVLWIDRYYYPGWEARLNGKMTPIVPSYPHGLIEISIPSGMHTVEFRLRPTWYERVSDGISLITLIVVLLSVVSLRKKRFVHR